MIDLASIRCFLAALSGWLNYQQQDVISYLIEENRTLRSQLAGRRLRLTDAQRRRLAQRGKRLGRRMLSQVATIVTPDTLLRWHRQLIARNGRTRRADPVVRACSQRSGGWWCGWPRTIQRGGIRESVVR